MYNKYLLFLKLKSIFYLNQRNDINSSWCRYFLVTINNKKCKSTFLQADSHFSGFKPLKNSKIKN